MKQHAMRPLGLKLRITEKQRSRQKRISSLRKFIASLLKYSATLRERIAALQKRIALLERISLMWNGLSLRAKLTVVAICFVGILLLHGPAYKIIQSYEIAINPYRTYRYQPILYDPDYEKTSLLIWACFSSTMCAGWAYGIIKSRKAK